MNDCYDPLSCAGHEGSAFVPVEIVEETTEVRFLYWGFWATIGLSAVVAAVYFAASTAVVVAFMIASEILGSGFDILHQDAAALESNGLLLGIGSLISVPAVLGSVWLVIRLRRGASLAEYLDLRGVSWRTWCVWLAAMMGLIVLGDAVTISLGQEAVPPFMADVWKTAGWLPLLWVALIVCAPLFEETFFRGFLFVGLWRSRLGGVGAVVLTSLAWAAIHVQYNAFQQATIFVLGILLGVARIRSRSLYVPMAMHALTNLVATVETAWVMMRR